MTTQEKIIEKEKLDVSFDIIQAIFLHYIEDSPLISNSPILNPKCKKAWDSLQDLKNHLSL